MRHDRELAHHQRFVPDRTAARSARRALEMFTPGLGSERHLTSMTDRWGTRSDDRKRVWVEIDRTPHAARCAGGPTRSRRRPPRGLPLKEGLS